jgi:cyclomaltodextrinase / maltogenic alpha-amylase / neopullulanase
VNLFNKNYSTTLAPEAPNWAKTGVIYEVNTRQYTPEGTFQAFAVHLPRLKELGVTILWFMPIHPIGEKRRKGSLGSYYSIRDYCAVNPEFGTLGDFKALVEKIHDRGMHVIMDLVANHTSWDNSMLVEHPEWYRQDETGAVISPLPDWEDVADLNYDSAELRHYMTEMMLYWVRNVGIDGYRCDVAEMVPSSFWRQAIGELRKIKPILMLAEGQHPSLHAAGFNTSYAFNMYWLFNNIAAGNRSAQEIDKFLEIDRRKYPQGSLRLRYTCNHDQNSWVGTAATRLGDAARVFAVLTFTLPGTPLIYSGQEAGLEKQLAFFDKDVIEWQESPWFSFYQSLCRLYNSNPALHSGDMTRLDEENPSGAYIFLRHFGKHQVLVLLNLTSSPVEGSVSTQLLSGSYVELFRRNRLKVIGESLPYSLPPWGYQVYVKEL